MQEGILSLQVLSKSSQGFRGRLHLDSALQGLPISVSGSAVQNITGEERRPAFFCVMRLKIKAEALLPALTDADTARLRTTRVMCTDKSLGVGAGSSTTANP